MGIVAAAAGALVAAGAATALAWRARAVGGLLAAGVSAIAAAAAATGGASRPTALALAVVFAVVSLAATAIGAALTRLLESEDGERSPRRAGP